MVKITPMIRISNEASGFAALEILLAAALISIVSTVGLPQTDLFAELSDRGDAIAAAAEAQNRVNVKFTELLISGLACEKARRPCFRLGAGKRRQMGRRRSF